MVNEAFARHQSGQLREAVSLYRTVLAVHPPIALVLSLAGDAAIAGGDPASGATLLNRALVLEPRKSSFLQLLAFAEATQGHLAAAEGHYASAVDRDPLNVSAMSDWANLVRNRQPGTARMLARKVILINPDQPAPLKLLAETTVSDDRLTAQRLFRRVTCCDPVDADTWMGLGLVAQAEKQKEAAAAALKRALLLTPGNAKVSARVGSAFSDQRLHRKAVRMLRLCVSLDSTVADNWIAYANALHADDQGVAAAAGYRRALLLDPGKLTAFENHLVVLTKSGEPADRIRAGYRCAFCVDPAKTRAWVNFGKFLLDRGAYSDAIVAMKSALI